MGSLGIQEGIDGLAGGIHVGNGDAHIHQLLPDLGVILEEEEAIQVGDLEELFGSHDHRGQPAIRLPDVVDPEEFKGLKQLGGIFVHQQADGLLVAPEAESGQEAEEQGHGDEHRQAAAPHAHAPVPHEFGLGFLKFLGIVGVFFLKLLELRLNGGHFDRGGTGLDIRKEGEQLQDQGADQNGKKYAIYVGIKPLHGLQEPRS